EYGYQFKQVAILDMAYLACFGSELAVVSMLPQFFITNYGVSHTVAGLTAGSFAVMNLFARPGGGFMSDAFGRRKVLMIALAGEKRFAEIYLFSQEEYANHNITVKTGCTVSDIN
uniref:MFS transporter n=1 Tax=Escherichia coli TaxID=562 RepID=UPI00200BB825